MYCICSALTSARAQGLLSTGMLKNTHRSNRGPCVSYNTRGPIKGQAIHNILDFSDKQTYIEQLILFLDLFVQSFNFNNPVYIIYNKNN